MGISEEETKVDSSNYKFVYEGVLEAKNKEEALGKLFYILNMEHPKDYTGHSLSVSDVVKLDDEDYYYCQPIGWQKIRFFDEKKLEFNIPFQLSGFYQITAPNKNKARKYVNDIINDSISFIETLLLSELKKEDYTTDVIANEHDFDVHFLIEGLYTVPARKREDAEAAVNKLINDHVLFIEDALKTGVKDEGYIKIL